MKKDDLTKANLLMYKIDFLQQKSNALHQACCGLVQKKTEEVTENQLTDFVRQLLESFEGCMALTDVVRTLTAEYERKIKTCEIELEEI